MMEKATMTRRRERATTTTMITTSLRYREEGKRDSLGAGGGGEAGRMYEGRGGGGSMGVTAAWALVLAARVSRCLSGQRRQTQQCAVDAGRGRPRIYYTLMVLRGENGPLRACGRGIPLSTVGISGWMDLVCRREVFTTTV